MAERKRGFVVIQRRIESWPLWRYLRADQRGVLLQILLSANWAPATVWIEGHAFTVGRGELLHSETRIAKDSNSSRQVVRTVIHLLEKADFLTRRATTGATRAPQIISITNYDRWQSPADEPTNETPTNQPLTNQGPTPREPEEPEEPKSSFLAAGETPVELDRREESLVNQLRRGLQDRWAHTGRLLVAAADPADAGKVPRIRDELESLVARVGLEAALAECDRVARREKSKRGRWPSALAYFLEPLRAVAAKEPTESLEEWNRKLKADYAAMDKAAEGYVGWFEEDEAKGVNGG